MILAVTGHRPDKLGGYFEPNTVSIAVRRAITEKLDALRPDVVMTGMALGVDQWTAEICVGLGVPFDAIIPFYGYENSWPERSRDRFHSILQSARQTYVVTHTDEYSAGLIQRRNMYMVNACDTLLAVYNGTSGGTGNTVNYAMRVGKNIERVQLPGNIWIMASEEYQRIQARKALRNNRPARPPPAMDALWEGGAATTPRPPVADLITELLNNPPTDTRNISRPKLEPKETVSLFRPGRKIDID